MRNVVGIAVVGAVVFGGCQPIESGSCEPGLVAACACGPESFGWTTCSKAETFGACDCSEPWQPREAGGVPEPQPTEEPRVEPTDEPRVEPTEEPRVEPTEEPRVEPTEEPRVEPTEEPRVEPTDEPGPDPTEPTPTPGVPDDGRVLLDAADAADSPLVDVFAGPAGIIVVRRDGVRLLARDGAELARWEAPREVTAAAWDGELLGVADRARLSALDPASGLMDVATADLTEGCASAVMVSGGRFVCGPANDWDRIFHTYELRTGRLLARSSPYTYNGIPMRRVPGTDDFVTVTTDLSPSDFHLHRVREGGEVVFINESPYHGDFSATQTYAFEGAPATRLVNDDGLLLSIYGDGCDAAHNSFTSRCFVKDGELGTLRTGEAFVAMTSAPGGRVIALVASSSDPWAYQRSCDAGCTLQEIDVAGRRIVADADYALPMGGVIAATHDAESGALVIGFRRPGDDWYDSPYPGDEVVLLPLP